MKSVDEMQRRLVEIVGGQTNKQGDIAMSFNMETLPEAKNVLARIRHTQKELRLFKKDVNMEIKYIKSSYSAKKSDVQAGFFSSLSGKRAAGSDRARKREKLRRQRLNDLMPYEATKRAIDGVLIELDRSKLQIQSWINENKK